MHVGMTGWKPHEYLSVVIPEEQILTSVLLEQASLVEPVLRRVEGAL